MLYTIVVTRSYSNKLNTIVLRRGVTTPVGCVGQHSNSKVYVVQPRGCYLSPRRGTPGFSHLTITN
jgi:hypothetical protein